MINIWDTFLASIRRRVAAIIARLTSLTPGEDVNTSWDQSIKSYTAVPEAFKGFFAPLIAEGRPIPYAVLTPTFEGFLHTTTEKLIFHLDREIWILERNGNSYLSQCFPLEGIRYVEVGTVLLDSRIRISGVTKNGIPAACTFTFNTATDILFTPILEVIRLAGAGSGGDPRQTESEKFDPWMGVSFKFMSYAKRSLLGGERVISAVLQPEIRSIAMAFLGLKFYRRISPTVAVILTDRELILIREEEKQIATERYGGSWDFIPLQKIAKLSLTPGETDVLVFSIHLPPADHLECLFQTSVKPDVDQLIDRFKELTSA